MIILHTHKGEVVVNPESIRLVLATTNGSKIIFDLSHHLLVSETPSQIRQLIREVIDVKR